MSQFDRGRVSYKEGIRDTGWEVSGGHLVDGLGCQAKEFKLCSVDSRKPLIFFEHEW